MLRGIRFNDKRFDKTDGNNIFGELTDNTIVICRNYDMMEALAKEIIRTVNGRAEHNDYDCDEEDVGKTKYTINFFLQKVIDINGQTITLCLEPAMVYKAKSIRDIWFFDRNWPSRHADQIYPMTVFKGAEEVWERSLDAVYNTIVIGRYGGYTGEWIEDERKHRVW